MTTRILVVGDTHCTRVGAVPDVLLELADRADHVVHTGDVTGIDVLDALEALSPVTGVCGNVDGPDIAARLPEQALVELDGVRIGVVHDAGPRLGRHARLRAWFPDAHVIAYGHSHLPELERIGDGGAARGESRQSHAASACADPHDRMGRDRPWAGRRGRARAARRVSHRLASTVLVCNLASPDHPNDSCTAGARLLRLMPMLLLVALVVVGCGDDMSKGASGSSRSSTELASDEQDAAGDTQGRDAGADTQPTRAARAAALRFDALVTTYAPVSARVNFLVTAETLRRDAVESGSGEAVELERTGQVRVELRRMRDVLAAARPNVAGANVSSEQQRQLQQLLLAAIDARRRSLVELDLALDAIAAELADSVVDERYDAWDASWNESLRAAREATTMLQDRRAQLGLEPALEESIR